MHMNYRETGAGLGEGLVEAPEYGFSARLKGRAAHVMPMLEIIADHLEHASERSPDKTAPRNAAPAAAGVSGVQS